MNNIFAQAATDLGRTVAEAKALLIKLNNADTSKRPSPGKWSKKEILGHLMDSANNNHQRFVRAAIQGNLTFPGYEQDRLVDLQRFREMDWGFLVDLWTAYNRFLAHVLTCLPERRPIFHATSATTSPPLLAGLLKTMWRTSSIT